MMIQMNKAVEPGQACLTSVNRYKAAAAGGCHRNRNLVNDVGKRKLGGNIFISSPSQLVVAPTTPIERRRLMATSNANADIANNNSLWPSIPSSSYGDPCLDLFFNALRPEWRDANPCLTHLEQLLPLAWSHNPLTTLKLIFTFNSKDFSDTKFDTAVLWLHHNHPKTLLRNLHSIANLPLVRYPRHWGWWYNLVQILYKVLVPKSDDDQDDDAAAHLRLHPERYDCHPDYRLLHDRVIDIFVECLKSDTDKMNSDLLVSRPAECCTSTRLGHDHWTGTIFLLESIARRLAPPELDQSQQWKLKWLRNEFLGPMTIYYNAESPVWLRSI
ncbi:uncharacterized protein LOC117634679 isoform X1 [Prunus dulcis]|uniref:uncharacterized protein LOC117634679 isoform X1 n=2 Tax=Prunus dulcis TaxID=3755 RepID=UPI0014834748|nr:uncharacterized protein LOC117634679 isoform X1 [Prunus dulcis]